MAYGRYAKAASRMLRCYCFVFRTLEDNYEASLPDVLTRAKQIILNKPGPSTPMNKRLITILPPLFLAYSGTRFCQLQEWQTQVFSSALCGGIKGRNMADISVDLRAHINEAQANNDPIVGIKLDQESFHPLPAPFSWPSVRLRVQLACS